MQTLNLINEKEFMKSISDLLYSDIPSFTPQNLRDIKFVEKNKENVIQSLILQCLKKKSRTYFADIFNEDRRSLPFMAVTDPTNLPEWAQNNLRDGIKIFRYTGEKFPRSVIDNLTKARDFLYEKATAIADRQIQNAKQKPNAKKDVINLSALQSEYKTFDAILAGANKWHKEIEERAQKEADKKKSLKGTEFLMDLPNGLKAYRLLTPEALDYESDQMGHCVGSGGYDKGVKSGKTKIYSLRDGQGKPHVTFEVRMKRKVEEMYQCKGKGNQAPVSRYLLDAQTFIKEKKFKIKEDLQNTGLIYQDGEYYSPNDLPEGLVIKGDLHVSGYEWEEFPASFSKIIVEGNFICYNCKNLKSLKNAPQSVGGDFDCWYCENLKSLEGAPQSVGGNFDCHYCRSLISLEGAPQSVGGDFVCSHCENISSLEGSPQSVGGDFVCSCCDNLITLKGAPQSVGGNFDCSACEHLTFLEGAPQSVGGNFSCWRCKKLKSLEGATQSVGGNFDCSSTNITSLEGAAQSVGGNFDCSFCASLTTLKGSPQSVGENFDCHYCRSLISLEGATQSVGGNFDCSFCASLTTLKGSPQSIGGNFDCSACEHLTSLEDAPQSVKGDFNCSDCNNISSLKRGPQSFGGKFLTKNAAIIRLNNQYYDLKNLPEGLVVKGDMDVSEYTWEELPECFSKIIVEGSFNCSKSRNLKSLKNAPQSVGGDFICSHCENLSSLEGVPQSVGRNFDCSHSDKISSLVGAPQSVGGNFDCSNSLRLTSLKGAPQSIRGHFDCSDCWNLRTLEGAPQSIRGNFDCSNCHWLPSLGGSPQSVGGNFDCSKCEKLTSLEGALQSVGGNFDCSKCEKLTSLEGALQSVGGNFDCSKCDKLTSLEGAPQSVGGDFVCWYCKNLRSLEGFPQSVGGDFDCSYSWCLTSLKNVPIFKGKIKYKSTNISIFSKLFYFIRKEINVLKEKRSKMKSENSTKRKTNEAKKVLQKLSSKNISHQEKAPLPLKNETIKKETIHTDIPKETIIQKPLLNTNQNRTDTSTKTTTLISSLNNRRNVR
ncbi:MAG: PcfJ domain-containing protein [Alphaproteobacteria bacterium]|nr:PcfJ domain-containing protein [Alphaproteobacteria bacterium]